MVRRKGRREVLLLCLGLASQSIHISSFQSAHHQNKPHHAQRIRQHNRGDRSMDSISMVPRSNEDALKTSSSSYNKLKEIEQEIVRLGRSGNTKDALTIYFQVRRPTVRIMNAAIDACSRSRETRLDQAFDIFQDGIKNKKLQPNVFTFGALMNACSRARDADRALQLLRSMGRDYQVEPNAVVYSSAIAACARADPPRIDTALNLLREAVDEKELPMSVVGYNSALSACAQAGDWKNAINLLRRMEEASSSKNSTALQALVPAPDEVTYGTVFAACERGEQWELLLKNAQSMRDRNMELDVLSVTSCLHACQQLGLAKEALDFLELMKTATTPSRKTSGWKRQGAKAPLRGPDEVAYRMAISACARGGEWREGLRLLREYSDILGKPANVVAYTAAITGCEYAGEWKEAFALLSEMRSVGVEPNERTIAAVIGACAVACSKDDDQESFSGDLPDAQMSALRLLNAMKKDESVIAPNTQVYNAAIRVCAEACDAERAFDLLEEMEEQDIPRTQFTYGSLMTACERVGDVESASKVFRKMKEDGVEPNEIIYGAAISCCRKANESERTLLLLRKMLQEKLSPNVATFNTVILAQSEKPTRKSMERAVLVYKAMKSKHTPSSSSPNRQTYNLLIRLFASNGEPTIAESFLQKMREDDYVPDVDLFTVTVTGYERAGQPMKALQLMESMQKDGYDFYEISVLNSAFKNALKLVNKFGRGISSSQKKFGEAASTAPGKNYSANIVGFPDFDAEGEEGDDLISSTV